MRDRELLLYFEILFFAQGLQASVLEQNYKTGNKLVKRVQYLAPKALQFLKAKTNLFTILKLHNHFVRM